MEGCRMNDFDRKIQETMKKDIELTENFKNGVIETLDTLQKNKISKKQNKTRHRFFIYKENYYGNFNRGKHCNCLCYNNEKN